jgi:NAD-dependent DNA ligase
MELKLYEMFNSEELKIAEKIQQRRLQMIVHSAIYYIFNDNIVSNSKWSQWGRELKDLQEKYPDVASKVIFAEAFKDWDASTGFNLPIHDDWVTKRAIQLMNSKSR